MNETLIHYNWMPCVADWSLDYSDSYFISIGVTKLCKPPTLTETSAGDVKENDIVFVKTDYLKNNYFQSQILPHIQNKFILVSGNSDFDVDNYDEIINNKNVLKWFCTNPPIDNEKVIGIPIGFQEKERVGGNQKVLKRCMNLKHTGNNKVLLPYHTESTSPHRKHTIEFLKNLPFVDFQSEKLPFEEYLNLLTKYKYCICLEGNGDDTHRNYECLLVGTVPIIKNTNIDLIYRDWNLPSIFIDDWRALGYPEQSSEFDFSSVGHFLKTSSHFSRIINIKEASIK